MPGKRLAMGELEARVMNVLWEHDAPMTPGEVQERLAQEREIAYTTVMTILVRLHGKGLVDRQRYGRPYAYQPRESRGVLAARRMKDVLDSAGSHAEALASFVGSITPSDRAQLRRLLDRARSK